MKISGNISFNGVSYQSRTRKSKKVSVLNKPIVQNDSRMSAIAWRANMLPFTAVKLSTDDFKAKMLDKLDRIRQGTYTRPERAEQMKHKGEALLNLTGPLKLVCDAVSSSDLKDINVAFANVKDSKDLIQLLRDPKIPDNVDIIITEPSTANYDSFMKEVVRGNATNDVTQATAIVEKATNELPGDVIDVPELSIKSNSKSLIIGLLEHMNAGLEYTSEAILSSPYIDIFSRPRNEIEVTSKTIYEK